MSPYIAAFFAFFEAKESQDIAIYSYREYIEGRKSFTGSKPKITQLGQYTKTHKRHFLQQCQYTICTTNERSNDVKHKVYSSHEGVEYYEHQDFIRKYIIPSSERKKVLKKLDLMNINAYSLFDNEDSLISTLAYREIEVKI